MSEKKTPMSYKDFEKFVNMVIHDYRIADAIYKASDKNLDLYEVYQSIGGMVDVLAYIFHDESDWIGYYIWELDCGKEYKPGMIKDKDNNNIPLETVQNLYDLLIDDFNYGLN